MEKIKVELKGEIKEFDKGITPLEIANSISAGLARVAVCGKIDGKLVDLNLPLDSDCSLIIVTNKDKEYQEVMRHSCAHVLAQIVSFLLAPQQTKDTIMILISKVK